MDQQHGKNARCFVPDRKARNSFLIHHSAQDVKYAMTEFVPRNVDCIPDEYVEMMQEEADKQAAWIFQGILNDDSLVQGKKKLKTIWAKFDM